MTIRLAGLLLIAAIAMGASLPKTGPVPDAKPAQETAPQEQPQKPESSPSEDRSASEKREEKTPDAETPQASEPVPVPSPKPEEKANPEKPESGTDRPEGGESRKPEEAETPAPPPPPPLVKEDPEELKACLADLTALGAKFKPAARIDEGEGCGIEQPVEVDEVLPGVDLGGALMRCKTAATMAHWLKQTVQPALDIARPGRRITGIVPGSTYACRLRNGASTGKISEHARGNAIDVAAFKLDNGETLEMKPREEDSTLDGAFQRTATAGACLHFTTVLSPGSDAAHETHLHLDVLERRNGYRYCR